MAEPMRISAEFADAAGLVAAVRRLRDSGFRDIETGTPCPVPELAALAGRPSRLPWIAFGGGLAGFVIGLGLQRYATVHSYPLDIGGRPLDSWPMYLPTVYEFVVGLAVLAAVLGLLLLTRLPRYHHPAFDTPGFARASTDRFFLLVTLSDPSLHSLLHEELDRCRPLAVSDLPAE